MNQANKTANEKYDALMVIEETRIQKEKEAAAKKEAFELQQVKEEVERRLAAAE
jgi:hypothetical protein